MHAKNLRLVQPSATPDVTPCDETAAWLLWKVLYRACEFANQDEAATFLDRSLRTVQRTWKGTAEIRGRDLMRMKRRAEARGFVVATLPIARAA
jgi:hypothetical protein